MVCVTRLTITYLSLGNNVSYITYLAASFAHTPLLSTGQLNNQSVKPTEREIVEITGWNITWRWGGGIES